MSVGAPYLIQLEFGLNPVDSSANFSRASFCRAKTSSSRASFSARFLRCGGADLRSIRSLSVFLWCQSLVDRHDRARFCVELNLMVLALLTIVALCPLCPQKQTSIGDLRMSALCQ